jgi:GMP synthase (glutamine-hydrolysing)
MKERGDLKVLLMQVRRDDATKKEELDIFAKHGDLEVSQIDILNVFDTPVFGPEVLDGYDALFVGGSSDLYVAETDKYSFLDCGKKLLRHCCENDIPVFASCFGFQLAVVAFDGTVIPETGEKEIGTYTMKLTEAAKKDIIFEGMPEEFCAVSAHNQRADGWPEEFELLVYSDLCPYHSFKVKGKPFYAFQFHPEVDKQCLIDRLTRYQEVYLKDAEALQKMIDSCLETPFSGGLVKNFVDRILLDDKS